MKPSLNRRQLLQSVSAAGLSSLLGNMVANGAGTQSSRAPYKRCVTLWMQGGPSQFETIDPKPGTETGGPLQAVPSRVPGLQLCETFSALAQRAEDLCLIRSVGSKQGEHERATHLLHTGYERIASFPRPSLGSFVSSQSTRTAVPGFVTLGGQVFGPAFLGTPHGPFVVSGLEQTLETLDRVRQRSDRLNLISELNERYQTRSVIGSLQRRSEEIDTVRRMIDSPFASAFNLSKESNTTLERYGDSDFGRNVLAARRLLETGVKYVEVQMPGWDTHVGNFPTVKRLCSQVEPAWLALMDDLKSSGLWDETLILWMGEFGRTPGINGGSGRDHYPQSIPVALAGHSFDGQVIGSTGRDGRDHSDSPHNVADLMYTLLNLLGVDPDQELTTQFGSPTTATDEGELIPGVIA